MAGFSLGSRHQWQTVTGDVLLQVGQTFTIEPILHMGKSTHRIWRDGWTAVTRDSSLSAQFEHTLLITKQGCEILTAYE